MKNAAQHIREFRKLLKKIRKENATPFPQVDDPMEQLLRGILTDHASETRANAGLARLWETVVDINDLRVTPVAEIVEAIGADFPMCRKAAEDIVKALVVIFNKLHHLDLSFLKKAGRRTAESFLNSLDGVNPHARATVMLRCLRGHAVPADATMCEIMRREGCVEPDATTEQIQKFLASQIRESQAASFYAQFKRYAATHVPRKLPPPPTPPAAPATPPAKPAAANSEPKKKPTATPGKPVPRARPMKGNRSSAASRAKGSPNRKRSSRPAKAAATSRKSVKRPSRSLRRHR